MKTPEGFISKFEHDEIMDRTRRSWGMFCIAISIISFALGAGLFFAAGVSKDWSTKAAIQQPAQPPPIKLYYHPERGTFDKVPPGPDRIGAPLYNPPVEVK